MTPFVIIVVIILLIFFGTRKKKTVTQTTSSATTLGNSSATGQAKEKFKSNINQIQFPDRVDAIVWHINAIDKGLAEGDLTLTNLSYAKLIESIRQQNENEQGKYENALTTIREEYEQFRKTYGMEYPKQFLPPSQRQKVSPTSTLSAGQKKILEHTF